MPSFNCEACRDTGHVFGPGGPFETREVVECESEACIKRRAIEALEQKQKEVGGGERKIFKGGEMKLSLKIKGFEIDEKTYAMAAGEIKQLVK